MTDRQRMTSGWKSTLSITHNFMKENGIPSEDKDTAISIGNGQPWSIEF